MGERSARRWGSATCLVLIVAGLTACGAVKQDSGDGGLADANVQCGVCDPNATCQGTTCVCGSGWEGNGTTCSDVNECLTANGGCDVNADCSNNDGGRDCACKTGFVGDGLSCRQAWLLVGSFAGIDINPENFGAKAAGVGRQIFFGPEANGVGVPFMRAFDTMAHTLSAPLALPPGQSDFCACGFTDSFLGAGNELYMMGNNGFRYAPAPNTWSAITSYVDPFRRGEAAAAYDTLGGAIYFVGGRSNETTTILFSVSQQLFANGPGTVPFAVSQGVAWVFSGDHRLYVTSGNGRQLASLDLSSPDAVWGQLSDAPTSLSQPRGMGEFQAQLWVATSAGLSFFDPGPKQWDGFVAAPAGMEVAVVADGNTYALCKTTAGLEIYQLNAFQ
jgi:hypothetical protein